MILTEFNWKHFKYRFDSISIFFHCDTDLLNNLDIYFYLNSEIFSRGASALIGIDETRKAERSRSLRKSAGIGSCSVMQTSDGHRKFSQLACCRGWSTLGRSQAVLSSDLCEYLVLSSAADNLFAGQTAVGKISSCLALNSISHLVNVTKDMMACSLIMTLLAKVLSCLESTWSLTASNLVRKKMWQSISLLRIICLTKWRRLSPWWWSGLRVIWVMSPCSPLAASDETSSAQFHNCCSANGSVPVVSRWVGLLRVSTVYICEIFSIASSQWARQRRWRKKFRFYLCWCRRKSPDKMTCWEVANWTELLYWGCLTLVSWLLKRSKKPRRRKNALEGGWERDKQDAGCWTSAFLNLRWNFAHEIHILFLIPNLAKIHISIPKCT